MTICFTLSHFPSLHFLSFLPSGEKIIMVMITLKVKRRFFGKLFHHLGMVKLQIKRFHQICTDISLSKDKLKWEWTCISSFVKQKQRTMLYCNDDKFQCMLHYQFFAPNKKYKMSLGYLCRKNCTRDIMQLLAISCRYVIVFQNISFLLVLHYLYRLNTAIKRRYYSVHLSCNTT